jgi:hypothetical protein
MKKPNRVNFVKIREEYAKRGVKGVRLTESSLFLTQAIDPTKANYTFDVLDSQNTGLQPDEIRLNINDEFIATHMGVYLYGKMTPVSETIGAPSAPYLHTYAPIEANAAMAQLDGLYAGQMKIGVNNIIWVEKWATRKCRQVQRTQFASFIAGVPVCSIASMESDMDGMIALEPMVTLSGAKKNEITLNLPVALTAQSFLITSQTGGQITFLIDRIAVQFFGLNAQNASVFQSR